MRDYSTHSLVLYHFLSITPLLLSTTFIRHYHKDITICATNTLCTDTLRYIGACSKFQV